MKPALFLTASALCLGPAAAFTSARLDARPATNLDLARRDGDGDGDSRCATFAASAVAAAWILAGAASGAGALAPEDAGPPAFADAPSVVLAGRSGGRAGGRAAPRAMPRSAPSSTTTKVYNTRTVIAAPPVVMGGGYGGYGYGGYGYGVDGLSLGLGAASAIGNGMREARQNEMIATERAELRNSQEREQELAARVRQLEMMQMQQGGGGGGQAQPQIIIAQPPAAVQAAPAK